MAASGIRSKLREVHPVCKDGGKAVPTTIVKVIELAREGIEVKRRNATKSSRQTDLEAKQVEIRAARCTVSVLISAAEKQVKFFIRSSWRRLNRHSRN